MTTKLISKEQEFVRRMAQSAEKTAWGFGLLLERVPDDLDAYFDLINGKGLFDAKHNRGPMPAKEEGFVHIPYWPALDYLAGVAKIAGERGDNVLGNKIMNVVRTVSLYQEPDGSRIDNFHTSALFAKIIGLVPLSSIEMKDIDLIPLWLDSKYDQVTVAPDLSKGILCRVFNDGTEKSLQIACRILFHCTALRRDGKPDPDRLDDEPTTYIDDYWLEQLLKQHIKNFADGKSAECAADIFVARLKEIFVVEGLLCRSDIKRPAIEENSQNYSWEGPLNHFIESLRDVLLNWVTRDSHAAQIYINKLNDDKTGIIQRIVIHTLNNHWEALKDIYIEIVSTGLPDPELSHELYELIKNRFTDMNKEQRDATLIAIRNLPKSDYGEEKDRELLLKRIQRNWLSVIADKGDDSVDQWYDKLNAEDDIGELWPHPGFSSYIETWRGPGPSLYTAQDLLISAKKGTLIELLNGFEETDVSRRPTRHALTDVLVDAIKADPQLFISIIGTFVVADRPFQYGIINGFRQLWELEENDPTDVIDWNDAWDKLIDFFEQILSSDNFWKEVVTRGPNLTPHRDWIAPEIARFLHSGTRDDNHSYPSTLLPRAWKLITLLLEKTEPISKLEQEVMFQVINSTRGKVIQALFSHTLRACRVRDQKTGSHHTVWDEVSPVYEQELDKCKGSNFEFSTLTGEYLAHLAYINFDWLRDNIKRIFSEEYPDNYVCILNGLAYSKTSRPVIKILIKDKIMDSALKIDLKGKNIRNTVLHWIALAFLWGDDALDLPRFKYLFEWKCYKDLNVISLYFLQIKKENLEAIHVERINDFWNHTIDWARSLDEPPANLLSTLSLLICYQKSIDKDIMNRLLIVVPHLSQKDGNRFFLELDRLFKESPEEVFHIIRVLSKTYNPHFDYQDRLKLLLKKIAGYNEDFRLGIIECVDEWYRKGARSMIKLNEELYQT